jgi:cytosine deaminase
MKRNAGPDLLLRNARLGGDSPPVDILLSGGRIAATGSGLGTEGHDIDVEGRLVAPAFVEPHFHLDKCWTGSTSLDLRTLEDYIAAESARKRAFTVDDVVARASRAIELLVEHGVTAIRTNVDVDTASELRGVEGVLAAAERYADVVDLQIVAFPQQGIVQDPGAEELLREALRMGAHVIGGHPQLEICDEDSQAHIRTVFEIAQEFGCEIDMHCDETDDPASSFAHDVAVETIRRGMHGKVALGHVCSLALQNPYYAEKVIRLLARAGITIITNPTSNLLFRALLDPEPRWRGLTRVRELLDGGVRVCFGQETVGSTYIVTLRHPDPLLTAQILAHGAGMKSLTEMDVLWRMMTADAAAAIGIDGYGVAPGCRGDLVVLDAETVNDAIATIAPRRWVIRAGRVVATTHTETTLTVD